MTDKQIIIDGVPVQDCCYFDYENDGYEDSCYIHQNECSAQNCYYKQLKRLEAQCEGMFVSHTDLEKKYKAKEQECEELKEKVKKYGEINEQETKDYAELKAENDTYKKMLEDEDVQLALTEIRSGERYFWYNKADKLSKTLTEIEEIAETQQSWNECNRQFSETESEDDIFAYNWSALKQILQKISEVLE